MRFGLLETAALVFAVTILYVGFSVAAGTDIIETTEVAIPAQAATNLDKIYELVEIPSIVEYVATEQYFDWPFQGLPLDGQYSRQFKKVTGRLTEHEKMLAFGWVHPSAEDYWQLDFFGKREYEKKHPTPEGRGWVNPKYNPVWGTVFRYRGFYEKNGRPPANTWELIRDGWYGQALISGEALEKPEAYLSTISPVTGKLIEFTHEEHSPGNMWITVVDQNTLDKVAEGWYTRGPNNEELPMTEFEGTVYYYRVYGHEGIIRTGMLEITDYAVGIL